MSNKLLVVVDYQHDFVEGSLGFTRAKTLEDGIYNKVKKYLDNNDNVVFTYDTHYVDYLYTKEGKKLPIPHCINGTEGHELYGKISDFKFKNNVIHMKKETFGISPFAMNNFGKRFKDLESIEFVGIVTNMCVISNVVMFQSQYPNAEIIVDASLCAGFIRALHEKALDVLESIYVKVINREEK